MTDFKLYSPRAVANLLSFMLGFASLNLAGTASATTVTIGSPAGCDPPTRTVVIPGSGSVSPIPWNVETDCPAYVLAYSAGGGATLSGGAKHTYSLILENEASTGPIPIESGPYEATNGFSVSTLIDGFASYQGNPGESQFNWNIIITGIFDGGSSTSVHSGTIMGSPQKRFRIVDFANFPGIRHVGPFTSFLTVTTSGIGELHLERTGIAALAPAVPEPSTWTMLITGFGIAGATMRRRRVTAVVA